ncbi:MAG: hypothetical protein KatS3mg131_0302 [Candidatus Tectimicrobiota bacterium]|nr:MAG: hypothetical protein KatS3mg131_0302 [Candidatus Tectomicrobia bacterium]
MSFGERLYWVRKQRGFGLHWLSAAAGIDCGLISLIERGKRSWNSVPVAKRLARALGVTLDYLAGMYEDERSLQERGLPQPRRNPPQVR